MCLLLVFSTPCFDPFVWSLFFWEIIIFVSVLSSFFWSSFSCHLFFSGPLSCPLFLYHHTKNFSLVWYVWFFFFLFLYLNNKLSPSSFSFFFLVLHSLSVFNISFFSLFFWISFFFPFFFFSFFLLFIHLILLLLLSFVLLCFRHHSLRFVISFSLSTFFFFISVVFSFLLVVMFTLFSLFPSLSFCHYAYFPLSPPLFVVSFFLYCFFLPPSLSVSYFRYLRCFQYLRFLMFLCSSTSFSLFCLCPFHFSFSPSFPGLFFFFSPSFFFVVLLFLSPPFFCAKKNMFLHLIFPFSLISFSIFWTFSFGFFVVLSVFYRFFPIFFCFCVFRCLQLFFKKMEFSLPCFLVEKFVYANFLYGKLFQKMVPFWMFLKLRFFESPLCFSLCAQKSLDITFSSRSLSFNQFSFFIFCSLL